MLGGSDQTVCCQMSAPVSSSALSSDKIRRCNGRNASGSVGSELMEHAAEKRGFSGLFAVCRAWPSFRSAAARAAADRQFPC